MIMMFAALAAVATVGWIATGYAMLASRQGWEPSAIWYSPPLRAFGFLLAMVATVASAFVGRWWWAPIILLVTPNVGAIIIYAVGDRLHPD